MSVFMCVLKCHKVLVVYFVRQYKYDEGFVVLAFIFLCSVVVLIANR